MNQIRTALTVVAILTFATPAWLFAQSDNAAVTTRLLSGSPWKGMWTFEQPGSQLRGELQMDFALVEGNRLEGRISNVSPANSGPVTGLTLKQDGVSFTTKGGVSMQLNLTADNRLKGTGTGPRGGTANWDLAPAK